MGQNKSIALIVCYFGKLPWYFDYFVHSCKYNLSVDFFIVTDDLSYSEPLTPNVRLIYKTITEVSSLASKKLGLDVWVNRGYKLCDFKPAYGFIFSELLANYDFWGHIDLDIIFGNIRQFMTDDLLENHDLISVRPDWIPGCFLLFKNTLKMNMLFQQSKDYKKVFTSNTHYCFDETNFAHEAFEEGKPYYEINTEIESMMHVVKKMEAIGYINPYFDLHIIEGVPGKLKWEKGIMTYRNRYEILLYHLIRLKKSCIQPKKRNIIPDVFTISPTKIYHKPKAKNASNQP